MKLPCILLAMVMLTLGAAEPPRSAPPPVYSPGAGDGSGYTVRLTNGQTLQRARLRAALANAVDLTVDGRTVRVTYGQIADTNLRNYFRAIYRRGAEGENSERQEQTLTPPVSALQARLRRFEGRGRVLHQVTNNTKDPREATALGYRDEILRTAFARLSARVTSEQIDWPKAGWSYVRIKGELRLASNDPKRDLPPETVTYEVVFNSRGADIVPLQVKIGGDLIHGREDY